MSAFQQKTPAQSNTIRHALPSVLSNLITGERFAFTTPKGNRIGNLIGGGSLMNDRGIILDAYKNLWRNGSSTPLKNLTDIPDSQSFRPSGINTHGLISGSYYPNGVQTQQAGVLLPVEITYARGTNQGKPLTRIPLWSPSDGIGQGAVPGGSPNRSVSISWSNAAMTAVQINAFGQSITLQRTTTGGVIWMNQDQTSVLTLAALPLRDDNVQEVLDATLTFPAAGLSASRYPMLETAAGTNSFLEEVSIVSFPAYSLNAGSADILTLTTSTATSNSQRVLTETGAATRIFTDNTVTLKLPVSTSSDGSLQPSMDWTARGLANAKLNSALLANAT